MTNISEELKKIFKKELAILWIFSIVIFFSLILFSNTGKLPLGAGDFVFWAILTLLVALYRPRWVFFLLVGAVPLENIILSGDFLPFQTRPYQFFALILILAVGVLYFFRRLGFGILKPTWVDRALFLLIPLSFLPLLGAPDKTLVLKNNLVLVSFIALYYLARHFIRDRKDFLKTLFFLIGSYLAVATFGLYQVFAEKLGIESFEVMFGRPNSTFTEPDWLGIYLVFMLAVFFSLVFWKNSNPETELNGALKNIFLAALYGLIFVDLTLIILTVSRSAWLGAAVITFFYFLFSLFKKTSEGVKLTLPRFSREVLVLAVMLLASFALIHNGKLTKFDVFDRARSTATREQKITIACESSENIPDKFDEVGQLEKYNCRHINLEEIETYESQGYIVAETFRKDPNVLTRSQIYKISWEELKKKPILGAGFGTITQTLGADDRGAGLNESNIFLQVWAGSGIPGLVAFSGVLIYIFLSSFRKISPVCPLQRWLGCPVPGSDFDRFLDIFSILSVLALIVPNFFNAGLFMGVFWLGLAITASTKEKIAGK